MAFFHATAWLLDLASLGGPMWGLTSGVVFPEVCRHAVDGRFGVVFEADDTWGWSTLIDRYRRPPRADPSPGSWR